MKRYAILYVSGSTRGERGLGGVSRSTRREGRIPGRTKTQGGVGERGFRGGAGAGGIRTEEQGSQGLYQEAENQGGEMSAAMILVRWPQHRIVGLVFQYGDGACGLS